MYSFRIQRSLAHCKSEQLFLTPAWSEWSITSLKDSRGKSPAFINEVILIVRMPQILPQILFSVMSLKKHSNFIHRIFSQSATANNAKTRIPIRDLRYYRIGIKMSILLPKSIVSASYQYWNFRWESINISIGIEILDIESISISIGIDFLNIQSQA